MVLVVAIAVGSVALAIAAAWLVLRAELAGGGAPRFSWRLALSGVQAWIAGGVVAAAALLGAFRDVLALEEDERVAGLALALERTAVVAALAWAPFALGVAVILARCVWAGRKAEVTAPLLAAALYAVALATLGGAGLLTR